MWVRVAREFLRHKSAQAPAENREIETLVRLKRRQLASAIIHHHERARVMPAAANVVIKTL